jgi:hypothetical protein
MGGRWLRLGVASGSLVLCLAAAGPAEAATGRAAAFPTVGKMYTWVPNLPKAVWAGGRALKFTIDTKQTSRDVVDAGFFVGMFNVGNNAAANDETRGVTVRWLNPQTKRWQKAYDIQRNGGWSIGPRAGLRITHDEVLQLRVKIWFGTSAWPGQWQLEAIVDWYSVYTKAGKNIPATLSTPNNPQYLFTVRH